MDLGISDKGHYNGIQYNQNIINILNMSDILSSR